MGLEIARLSWGNTEYLTFEKTEAGIGTAEENGKEKSARNAAQGENTFGTIARNEGANCPREN